MGREPKHSVTATSGQAKKSARTTRPSAAVSFVDDNEDNFMEEAGLEDDKARYDDEDIASDMSKFLQDLRKRQAKKNSASNTAFENQKKAIYAAGRARAQEISRDGIAYLENLKASLLDMRKNEKSYDRYTNDVIPMWNEQDEAVKSLIDSYETAMDNLFPKRAEAIALAAEQLESNPARREHQLKSFLAKAHDEVVRSRQNERIATDASKLIKNVKALLLSV
ncbi:hypothetical protein VNI00_012507 [Paramarasmius palmivorus]|uniref:Uncharacterized protein n=1 Tax=Paramarasmius palmivorus TaxID=297713 RepID=A0AAW0C496_9AGAR